jgi:hypothetical protein
MRLAAQRKMKSSLPEERVVRGAASAAKPKRWVTAGPAGRPEHLGLRYKEPPR